ncbi:MAG: nucleotidyltransferase family protein [Colwellia sp.]|nr:nucleotidyltransferase family protein [Colwellia sp.]
MKAMILAAGRGERMKPLTDSCPKPLLTVKGMPLIEYHISALAKIGVSEIIINHAWLGQQLVDYLGDGNQWQVKIHYSEEQHALETAGGIIKALPLLGEDAFLIVNGDVFTDFGFNDIPALPTDKLAHLWLVNNPVHNLAGDFAIEDGLLQNIAVKARGEQGQKSYTYSGIALFKPNFFNQAFFDDNYFNQSPVTRDTNAALPLAPLLRMMADKNKITASVLSATWTDVGTPERLAQLNEVR